MIPTLLLDLDDTLLSNKLDTFLPAYFQALASHWSRHVEPNRFIAALISSTQTMIQNQRPDRTLKDIFEDSFYPSLGLNAKEVETDFDSFYAEVFPTLQPLTRTRARAIELIEYAFDCGYQVVIATNPLFPRTAILQRLEWAQISPQRYPFRLITSYETFHFTKPNPAYYAEILARIGWPSGPAAMIGDDLENDIYPARRLGLAAFWITENGQSAPGKKYKPSGIGELADVIPWLEAGPSGYLKTDYSSIDSILATLRATPAALHTLSSDLSSELFTIGPEPGEWCLAEILCHLRDVEEEVNLARYQKVVGETDPFLPGMVTDPWADERQYICQDGPTALAEFSQARIKALALLENAEPQDWHRTARHAIFGPTNLQELASINAGHDRLHVQQFHQTLKAISNPVQSADAVSRSDD
ncbi:MAG TPA: HAD-IA family hydrolase [Anaerolineales bacterium]|nr:HAD-IA family hydrolase [Anaerolineales bacterium]